MRHETPPDVAAVLMRHAPKTFENVLDPAVGRAALIKPLLNRIISHGASVTCIDTDDSVFASVQNELGGLESPKLHLVKSDFLKWAKKASDATFDLVVMNPPFAARKDELVAFDCSDAFPEIGVRGRYFAPIEAAFVVQGCRLLLPGGKLLAILPASLISADSTRWFREVIAKVAAFRVIHELPRRTFERVETRVYLCVIERSATQDGIVLQNHDLIRPLSLTIARKAFESVGRLDYGFYSAKYEYEARTTENSIKWTTLGELANIVRGRATSPQGPLTAVHTTDYLDGQWRRQSRHRVSKRELNDARVGRGDLLIKRVGRGCTSSLGRPIGLAGARCSDCVFIVRPRNVRRSTELLLTLKALLGFSWAAALLERGTGAAYITEKALTDLRMPASLGESAKEQIASYRLALRANNIDVMAKLEAWVRKGAFHIARVDRGRKSIRH